MGRSWNRIEVAKGIAGFYEADFPGWLDTSDTATSFSIPLVEPKAYYYRDSDIQPDSVGPFLVVTSSDSTYEDLTPGLALAEAKFEVSLYWRHDAEPADWADIRETYKTLLRECMEQYLDECVGGQAHPFAECVSRGARVIGDGDGDDEWTSSIELLVLGTTGRSGGA